MLQEGDRIHSRMYSRDRRRIPSYLEKERRASHHPLKQYGLFLFFGTYPCKSDMPDLVSWPDWFEFLVGSDEDHFSKKKEEFIRNDGNGNRYYELHTNRFKAI